MHSTISVSCVLVLLAIANAAVIPFHRIKISSELRTDRHELEKRVHSTLFLTIAQPPTAPATLLPSSSSASTASSSSTSVPSSTSPSNPSPSASGDASQKYVVAHHIVGNTFPYTLQDWVDDITLAHASGIDGFALNLGSDVWEPDRIADAYVTLRSTQLLNMY